MLLFIVYCFTLIHGSRFNKHANTVLLILYNFKAFKLHVNLADELCVFEMTTVDINAIIVT